MRWRPRICLFHLLLDRISEGIGVDVREDKIGQANWLRGPDDTLEFLQVDSPEAWPRDVCDCVTLIDVLHHVPRAKQKDFVQAIAATGATRIVLKDMDPEAKFKSMMNTLHDLLLSCQLPHYCERERAVQWLEQMGFEVREIGRQDMVWYAHYYLVAEKKGQ